MAGTTADLLAAIRVEVGAPDTDQLVSDAQLLKRLDAEMRSDLWSAMVATRSEYALRTYDVSVTAGEDEYRIPDRASGMALRDVLLVSGSTQWNVAQVDATERHRYSGGGRPRSAPFDFTLQDGKVVLLPEPTVSSVYTLRLRYYGRPSTLIETSSAAAISSASSTVKLVVPSAPAGVTTANALVDIVRGDGMHEPMFEDRIVASYAGGEINLDASTPVVVSEIATSTVTNQRVDYVCPRMCSVYPPFPELLWPALIQLGCRVYGKAIGNERIMQSADALYRRHLDSALAVMVPRVDGEPLKIVPRDTPLRRRPQGWWWT